MADEVKTIRIVVDSSRAVDGSASATRALAELEKQTQTMGSGFNKMEAGLERVSGHLRTQLALAAAAAAAYVTTLGVQALRSAGDLEELAEQLGITTTNLQALQYAGVQNGLKLEEMQTGVAKFSQKLGEAAGGSKSMIDAFDRLGVKIMDARGNLRQTETTMSEVAAAILKIEDPARRTAAQVEFFSRSGARFAPVLKEMAEGFDQMAARARSAGAIISDDTIKKLDNLNDAFERTKMTSKAMFAESAAGPLTTTLEKINDLMRRLAGYMSAIRQDWTAIFTHDSFAAEKNQGLIRDRETKIAEANERLRKDPGRGADRRLIAGWERDLVRFRAIEASGKANSATTADPDGIGFFMDVKYDKPTTRGDHNPNATGAGEDVADRIAKLRRDTARELAGATAFADASEKGAQAVQDLELHYKALKAAQDAYGKTAEQNAKQVEALTDEIEKQMKAIERKNALKGFNLETEGMERSNELLEAENRLINATVEERSREIALIKLKHEIESKGLDETNPKEKEAIERRKAAIEQNETLKSQGEQLRKVNELWTEPLKRALQDIQSTAASAFETMLEKGEFSAQALGDVFKRTVRRMIAEFLALATVRPVMSVVVQGLNNIGIVSNGMAQQLGFPSGSGGGFGAPSGGSFSLPQMPMGTSSGGMFGNFFASTPFASAVPMGGFDSIDDLLPSGHVAGTGLNSLSIGDMLGGIGSIGFGAYNLISGRGSTGSMIGGISGIIGGGLSLAASAGLIGSAFGPIGMGIGLIGGLLGGLLGGGGEPPIPPQPSLNLAIGSFLPNAKGGFTASGYGLNGGGSLAEPAGGLGTAVSKLFRQANVTGVPGRMIGGRIWSGVDHVLNGRQWSDRPYTQAALVNPGADDGGGEYITYNDSSRNLQQAADLLIAAVFKANVLRGGVSGASAALKAGLTGYDPQTGSDTEKVVTLASAYDRLGKAANPVKDAIDKLSSSLDELRDFAEKASVSMEPINAEIKKQTERVARDFIDGMLDPLAVQLRALEDERKAAMESAEYIRDNVKDVYVDMARVAEYYTNKEAALRNQFYQGGIANLQTMIKRLSYGDLANASPDVSLSGTRATYNAMLAQARAGDATAIANLASAAEGYAGSARGYFASSPEYDAIVRAIRQNLEEIVALQTGGATGTTGTGGKLSQESQALIASNEQYREMFLEVMNENREIKNKVSELIAQLRAQNTNRM